MRIFIYENNFKIEKNKKSYYFYSLKDTKELAWLDLKKNILYVNTEYKKRFKNAYADIKKEYCNAYTDITEYMNIRI